MNTDIFDQLESEVRFYCRDFPAVFNKAKGSIIYTAEGRSYIDFLCGAGALNYGHNNEYIKQKLVDYLQSDALIQGLDLYTIAKKTFLETLHREILQPKGLAYKVQFCGPTGANGVEAALKLARKVKNRAGIFAFMGGYHGMTLGSLAVSAQRTARAGAGVSLGNVNFMPYPEGSMGSLDTIEYMETVLTDERSGIEMPAAVICETVQAEGGVNVAPVEWLRRLRALCDRHDLLLICDDVQVGCGRTGPFFSFERAEIVPDMVILSKSISGYGLPMAILLIKPELDLWKPGEHSGTFRGHQLAFVAGSAALDYRKAANLEAAAKQRESYVRAFLEDEIQPLNGLLKIRGLGLIWGIDLSCVGDPELAGKVITRCFDAGLMIERSGRQGQVIKLLPALNIEMDVLQEGCKLLRKALADCFASRSGNSSVSHTPITLGIH
jgi:diaminobutyrate-2-oxoglutarate transaminase